MTLHWHFFFLAWDFVPFIFPKGSW